MTNVVPSTDHPEQSVPDQVEDTLKKPVDVPGGEEQAPHPEEEHAAQLGPIVPGPCNPVIGCPPPTEIVCVKVDKVYESCSLAVSVNAMAVGFFNPPVTAVSCVSINILSQNCEILAGGRVRTTFEYSITAEVTDASGTFLFTFPPPPGGFELSLSAPLARAGEPGLLPQCEIFGLCLDAFVPNENAISVCLGFLVIFKLFAHVQLLVPAYGFCPLPEECEVAGECPEFVPPDVIPYPPQILPDIAHVPPHRPAQQPASRLQAEVPTPKWGRKPNYHIDIRYNKGEEPVIEVKKKKL